jgi:hypothetical protein
MAKEEYDRALDDVVLLAVIEWDHHRPPHSISNSNTNTTIRKLLIRRRDLGTPPPGRPTTVCTVRDLRTCLRSSLAARNSAPDSTDGPSGHADELIGKIEIDVHVYDAAQHEYVRMHPVSDETSNLLTRFGSRIRIRLSQHVTDSSSSRDNGSSSKDPKRGQPLLAITDSKEDRLLRKAKEYV